MDADVRSAVQLLHARGGRKRNHLLHDRDLPRRRREKHQRRFEPRWIRSRRCRNTATVSSATADPRPDNNTSTFPRPQVDHRRRPRRRRQRRHDAGRLHGSPAACKRHLTATVDYQTIGITANAGTDFLGDARDFDFRAGETVKPSPSRSSATSCSRATRPFPSNFPIRSTPRSIAASLRHDRRRRPGRSADSVREYRQPHRHRGKQRIEPGDIHAAAQCLIGHADPRSFPDQDVTATADSDYLPINTSIASQPGETVKTFSIAIIGDTVYEPDETFNVVITGADNATFSTPPRSARSSTTTRKSRRATAP